VTSPSASSVLVATPSRIVAAIRLGVERQVPEQPGGPLHAEHQHAGGHRVQRAGVADLAGAQQPAQPTHHVVRGQAAWFVHDHEAGWGGSWTPILAAAGMSATELVVRSASTA